MNGEQLLYRDSMMAPALIPGFVIFDSFTLIFMWQGSN
jgi:hypothetical protein